MVTWRQHTATTCDTQSHPDGDDLDHDSAPRATSSPVNGRFEVQARRLVRRDGLIVRDETRHASTTLLNGAQCTARGLAAEGFTVWILRVEDGDGTRPVYRSIQTLAPAASTGSDRPRQRTVRPARGAMA